MVTLTSFKFFCSGLSKKDFIAYIALLTTIYTCVKREIFATQPWVVILTGKD